SRYPTRPTGATVDLSAIRFNLQGVRKRVGKNVRIMAVVKANAYGHGIGEVSRFAERGLADCFGVAFPEEGLLLREAGIRKAIHVFALPVARQAALYTDLNLEPTVCSALAARLLNTAAQRARKTLFIHLKIETGMNRIGVRFRELDPLLRILGTLNRLEIKGVYTHFAMADDADKSFTRFQLAEFERTLEILRRQGISWESAHCANSAAILDMPESHKDMVRPGVMMYGYYPSRQTSESVPLKPALTLTTRVALVKEIGEGETVSYGRRFRAANPTRIATLPIGYADGIPRRLTGNATALIRGTAYPIVGTIGMDQVMANVGRDDVAVGDEAVLIG
ncbi:MAG: alanine racemase, partial [Bacteroidota bacterium]